jgi:hypothetical protein
LGHFALQAEAGQKQPVTLKDMNARDDGTRETSVGDHEKLR